MPAPDHHNHSLAPGPNSGVRLIAANWYSHNSHDFIDAKRYYFILEPPYPQPPQVDLDATRAKLDAKQGNEEYSEKWLQSPPVGVGGTWRCSFERKLSERAFHDGGHHLINRGRADPRAAP